MQYIPWLDYAKIIGIFLVIYSHGGLCGTGVATYIYSFHMPLFFFISGMLYRPLTLKETLKKDWHKLVIPYLLLNLICWLPAVALNLWRGTFTLTYAWSCIGGTLLGLGYNTVEFTPISTPCWFIYALFLARLIISLLPKKDVRSMTALSVLSIVATLLLQHYDIDIYMPFDSAFLALPFICFGYMLRAKVISSIEKTSVSTLVVTAMVAVVWYSLTTINGRVDTDTCKIGHSLALYYAAALCGILVTFKLSQAAYGLLSPVEGGVKSLSKCTLIIVALNLLVISLCTKYLIVPSLHINPEGGLGGFISAIIIFILFIPICLALKRWAPILIGNRK